ncbi:hypothetical protein M8C21_004259 [Ambrosia artemisiifolia]|uniref:Uncharacterized protein n=1 Tax=Ambrosia artemisiifolia TaxID=4212 RepID=A0AAD5GAE0_AMBAR|nr:hypothetical protein M8C21_004259 [Ambrosia artemisiifolia]
MYWHQVDLLPLSNPVEMTHMELTTKLTQVVAQMTLMKMTLCKCSRHLKQLTNVVDSKFTDIGVDLRPDLKPKSSLAKDLQ